MYTRDEVLAEARSIVERAMGKRCAAPDCSRIALPSRMWCMQHDGLVLLGRDGAQSLCHHWPRCISYDAHERKP